MRNRIGPNRPCLSNQSPLSVEPAERIRSPTGELATAVVRTWNATATVTGAEKYRRYIADTLLPPLSSVAGCAGRAITVSVVGPEAQGFLLHFDATATHRGLWVDGPS